jgi:DNA-directed RNA polymerase specialized sigma subunit
MKELRLKITIKNNILISERERLGLTQIQMAKFTEIPIALYQELENLSAHPSKSKRAMKYCERLAFFLEMPIEELFPESLTKIKINKKEITVNSFDLQSMCIEPTQTINIELNELKSAVQSAVNALPAKQRQVIIERFGLDGREEKDLKTIGKDLYNSTLKRPGVNAEYARQIEARALRRLRHPILSGNLKQFVES